MSSFKTPKGTELPFLDLRGKQYLQIAHRLVWFREEKPGWTIKTSLVEKTDKHTIARAEIIDESGRLIADGFKEEHAAHFPDHMEKSLTGAVGRALALCGYGTQFAQELEEGETTQGPRIADAPHAPKSVLTPPPTIPNVPSNASQSPVGTHRASPQVNEYRVGFGKFKGKTLREVPAKEIESYVSYLESQTAQSGKPMSPGALEFCEQARLHLAGLKRPNLSEGDSPFEDDVPMSWEPGATG